MQAPVGLVVRGLVLALRGAVPKVLVVVFARRVLVLVQVVIMVVVAARALVQVIRDVLLLVAGHTSA